MKLLEREKRGREIKRGGPRGGGFGAPPPPHSQCVKLSIWRYKVTSGGKEEGSGFQVQFSGKTLVGQTNAL